MGSAPSAAEDIERVARSAGARVSQDSQGNSGCRCNRSIYTRRPDPFPCPTTSYPPIIGVGGQGGWSLIPSLPETCPCSAFLLVDPWRPPRRWHVSRPAWRSARLASSVGLERGPVSLRKVSSGGPCRYSINRSRISSRSLVSNWCACRSPCTDYQPGPSLPQANFLGATEPRAARPRN